jgi:hypothetical protein
MGSILSFSKSACMLDLQGLHPFQTWKVKNRILHPPPINAWKTRSQRRKGMMSLYILEKERNCMGAQVQMHPKTQDFQQWWGVIFIHKSRGTTSMK